MMKERTFLISGGTGERLSSWFLASRVIHAKFCCTSIVLESVEMCTR